MPHFQKAKVWLENAWTFLKCQKMDCKKQPPQEAGLSGVFDEMDECLYSDLINVAGGITKDVLFK